MDYSTLLVWGVLSVILVYSTVTCLLSFCFTEYITTRDYDRLSKDAQKEWTKTDCEICHQSGNKYYKNNYMYIPHACKECFLTRLEHD